MKDETAATGPSREEFAADLQRLVDDRLANPTPTALWDHIDRISEKRAAVKARPAIAVDPHGEA
jgi:hypothetical protein